MSGIKTIDDIKQRCVVDDESGCWLWQGYREPRTGRPAMSMIVEPGVRRCVKISVALHIIKSGKLPTPSSRIYFPVVCREMGCCNPAHHRLLTKGQINKLVGGHGAAARAKISAANFGKGRLSESDRAEIAGSDMKLTEIMERWGISLGYASQLRRGIVGSRKPQGASVFNWRPA